MDWEFPGRSGGHVIRCVRKFSAIYAKPDNNGSYDNATLDNVTGDYLKEYEE